MTSEDSGAPSWLSTPASAGTDTGSADRHATDAAKQIALSIAFLVVVWVLASVLAPDPTIDGRGARSLLSMPFVAALFAVVALFSFNALAFDRSQLRNLNGRPFMAGVTCAALWFVLGVFSINATGLATVLHLFFTAVLVAALVGAVAALGQLLILRANTAESPV